ncbi:cation diffusion facilitator family transporter [Methanobacterium sp. ACI-7]|uniref:cation diffusion facilitator family transporter n=1 Tax=unclassified Methanobacterium TaxID=2627676 RepID=UPI0039C21A82
MDSKLSKRALNLAYFTIIYNVLEGILSIFAGLSAGSISLIGFGLDSAVESLSAAVIAWRFRKQNNISKDEEERIEKNALKYIGYTFFILAIYVLYESIMKLYNAEISEPSILGILITGTSLIVMPVLFYYKYQTGKSLKSRSVIADSKETLACSFLSGTVLVGLLANYFYGFWQADPLIGFLIVIFLLREGYEIFKDI